MKQIHTQIMQHQNTPQMQENGVGLVLFWEEVMMEETRGSGRGWGEIRFREVKGEIERW